MSYLDQVGHNDQVRIKDALESIHVIFEHIEGKTDEFIEHNLLVQDAIIRRILVIGEALHKTSAELQVEHPEIPWKDLIDLRNTCVHEYSTVNARDIIETVKNELAVVEPQLLTLQEQLAKSSNKPI